MVSRDDVRVIACSPNPDDEARAAAWERLARIMIGALPEGAAPQAWLRRILPRCGFGRVRVLIMRCAQRAKWRH